MTAGGKRAGRVEELPVIDDESSGNALVNGRIWLCHDDE